MPEGIESIRIICSGLACNLGTEGEDGPEEFEHLKFFRVYLFMF
jgi:hypothetical protein